MRARRVLIVDDDAAMLKAVSRVLSNSGYEVVPVTDVASARKAVVRERFDVILTDINMPGESGLDLLRAVRALSLETPVIVMTANPCQSLRAEAMKLGAADYLEKPVPRSQMLLAIARLR